jgi:hypothetical protein
MRDINSLAKSKMEKARVVNNSIACELSSTQGLVIFVVISSHIPQMVTNSSYHKLVIDANALPLLDKI